MRYYQWRNRTAPLIAAATITPAVVKIFPILPIAASLSPPASELGLGLGLRIELGLELIGKLDGLMGELVPTGVDDRSEVGEY